MDINAIDISTVVSVAIGGVIALSTIWLKQYLDEIREIQKWYEETYLGRSLEPLLNYIDNFKVHATRTIFIKEPNFQKFSYNIKHIPYYEATRLFDILGVQEMIYAFYVFDDIVKFAIEKKDVDAVDRALGGIDEVYKYLYYARTLLLSTRIRKKSHIFRLKDKRKFKKLNEVVKNVGISFLDPDQYEDILFYEEYENIDAELGE